MKFLFAIIMSLSISFEVRDFASPELLQKMDALSAKEMGHATGQFLAEVWRDWLADLPDNKMGWPSTGFWEKAARSVVWEVSHDGVLLSGDQQGLAQRYYGGDIEPLNEGGKLTIPAREEAYGKTASSFNNLKAVYRWVNGHPEAFALVEADATQIHYGRKLKGGQRDFSTQISGGLVMFWLVRSVHQEGNPNVVPPLDLFMEVIEKRIAEVCA
jgi:hypothetical protein